MGKKCERRAIVIVGIIVNDQKQIVNTIILERLGERKCVPTLYAV